MEEFFVRELLLSSSDSDTSSDDDIVARGPMVLRPRVHNYIELVVDNYCEEEFKENFRMKRDSFNQILNLIKDHIQTEEMAIGHHTLSARAQLLLVLWYFATPDSYRSICGRFDIGKATGLRSVRRVANALFQKCFVMIKWPTGNEFEQVVEGFAAKGFPNTIGAIDGTHIEIPKPKEHGISYINRHGYSSIILQGVCDHELKFTNCYIGEVRSCHDARVLTKSEIWTKINEQAHASFPNDSHLIGDKAYPCLPQLQCPYKDNGHLTEAQKNYNSRLSSARSTIERSFALLKGRFRSLKYLDVGTLEWVPKYVMACCVLHNVCMSNNDFIEIGQVPEHHDDDVIPDITEGSYNLQDTRNEEGSVLNYLIIGISFKYPFIIVLKFI